MNNFETFFQLHRSPTPLLIGNIWDVNSAKIFERQGFKAIGTSSAAVANSFGFEDGEMLPFEILLQLAKRVVKAVNIPLSIDIEGGYSRTIEGIIENIERLHDAGVVGVNLEDTIPDNPRKLQPVMEFKKILSSVAAYISQKNLHLFLNIRTDGFLLGMQTALVETQIRIKSYEDAGANGIFVPCIVNKDEIQEVVTSTNLPINVMCMPDLPNFEVLKSIGVKRISMGSFLSGYINKKTEEAVSAILEQNSFSPLFQ